MPPDHPRQMRVLLAERTMQVEPTPFRHGSQRAGVTVFRRYLSDDILTLPRLPPHMGEAKEVECGPRRRGMTPTGAFEPEVYEAGLGRMELKPIPTKPLGQHVQQSLAGQVVLKGDHRMISVSDQLAPSLESRSRHLLEPFIQHVVQIDGLQEAHDFVGAEHHRQLARLAGIGDALRNGVMAQRHTVEKAQRTHDLVQRRPGYPGRHQVEGADILKFETIRGSAEIPAQLRTAAR